MNSHISLDKKTRKEIQRLLDEQYMEGQRAQRDLDMLAMHIVFGFGAKRLNRFNDKANELVDFGNQWLRDDPKDGGAISRELVKKELEKIKGVVIGD